MIWYVTGLVMVITAVDIKTRKIPNPLILLVFFSILVFQLFEGALLPGLASFAATFALFLVLYIVRFLGAGDVKLISAISPLFLMPELFYYWFLTAAAGILISVIHVIVANRWNQMMKQVYRMVVFRQARSGTEKIEQALSFPFSIAVLLVWGVMNVWVGY
ncbi:hypothetical protein CR205_14175 [Alteribacter lacisalsi]|uniref:Prepilin type IV endopeptidase peptidase domain-containing protein n=1 Tax=Alteribacter lacisalsi TaxID=2045244 RepID=A0A2W0HIL0_9BACI|nr:A24 family peptidase [Alteribacter lacisalsi]PYZ96822.1 hypothetical protein CR205_14175 [Alteribacter lacisalsi]